MNATKLIIDTNILILLVVGSFRHDLIGRHKCCRNFDETDFHLAQGIVAGYNEIIFCPNTLTEMSNLVRQTNEPDKSALTRHMTQVLNLETERFVPSIVASKDAHFVRLGLTDICLLELCDDATLLLTVDLDLYLEAGRRSFNVLNLRHYREQVSPT